MDIAPLPAPDTVPLVTRRWGAGRPALVLLHGLAEGGFLWNAVIARLGLRFAGIAVDLRGHGDSPWPASARYTVDAFTADVVRMVEEQDLLDLDLVGHSLGADVAIRAAAAHPARIRSLTIIEGGPEIEQRGAAAIQRFLDAQRRSYSHLEELVEGLRQQYPMADEQVLSDFARCATRRADNGEFELRFDPALRSCMSPPDSPAIWQALTGLACPKLLVRGAMSSVLSRNKALSVSQRIPDCRFATVSAAGHAVAIENPQGLCDALTPFLAAPSSSPQG